MVMRNKAHMISVDSSEWRKTVAHHSEKGNEDIVNNIDVVTLSVSNIDPACATRSVIMIDGRAEILTNQEQHPSQAKKCDQGSV